MNKGTMVGASKEFKNACAIIRNAQTPSEVKHVVDRLDDEWKRRRNIMRDGDWVTLSRLVGETCRRIKNAETNDQ